LAISIEWSKVITSSSTFVTCSIFVVGSFMAGDIKSPCELYIDATGEEVTGFFTFGILLVVAIYNKLHDLEKLHVNLEAFVGSVLGSFLVTEYYADGGGCHEPFGHIHVIGPPGSCLVRATRIV